MEKRRREMLRDKLIHGDRHIELERVDLQELLEYCDQFDRFVEEVEREEQVRTR